MGRLVGGGFQAKDAGFKFVEDASDAELFLRIVGALKHEFVLLEEQAQFAQLFGIIVSSHCVKRLKVREVGGYPTLGTDG